MRANIIWVDRVVERLEGRRMLSASAGPVLSHGGELRVEGTGGNDQIVVSLDAKDKSKIDVSFNGVTSSFPAASVRRIRIDGRDGNDNIRTDESNGTISIPARLSGGAGDDTLAGGSGDDRLDGGAGNDVLNGDGGDDRLDGDAGDDKLDGGDGNDQVRGGRGRDDFAADDNGHQVRDRGRDDDAADDHGAAGGHGADNATVFCSTPISDDHGRRHGGHGADDGAHKSRPHDDHGVDVAAGHQQHRDARGQGRRGDDAVRR